MSRRERELDALLPKHVLALELLSRRLNRSPEALWSAMKKRSVATGVPLAEVFVANTAAFLVDPKEDPARPVARSRRRRWVAALFLAAFVVLGVAVWAVST